MALRNALIAQPHLYITDTNGRPLDGGKVYFGQVNKDPELYPIDIFYDDTLTTAAAQPVRTKNGFMSASGNNALVYANEATYSLKVLDAYGRQVYYIPALDTTNAELEKVKLDTGITVTPLGVGGVNRGLHNKLGDVLSVKDFGAKGDGVTDDAVAIQAALDAAAGGVLVLPKSSVCYLIKSPIFIKSGTLVLGLGGIVKISGHMTGVEVVRESAIRISGLKITADIDSLTTMNTYPISIAGGEDITIDHCHIYDVIGSAIGISQKLLPDYNKNIKVLYNKIERVGRKTHPVIAEAYGNGVAVTGGEDIIIHGNTITDVFGVGSINLEGTLVKKVLISSNIITRTLGRASGIKLYAGGSDVPCQDVVIRDNILYEMGDADEPNTEPTIWIKNGANVTIDSNTIKDCINVGGAGQIRVDSDLACKVINNNIYNCDNARIYVNTATKSSHIENNVIDCTPNHPVTTVPLYCESASSGLGSMIVKGNIIRNPTGSAIIFNPRSPGILTENIIVNPNNKTGGGTQSIYSLTGFKKSIVGNNIIVISDVTKFYAGSVYGFGGGGQVDMIYKPDAWHVDLEAFATAGKTKYGAANNTGFIQSEIGVIPKLNPTPTFGYNERGRVIYTALPKVGEPLYYICTVSGTPGTWVAGAVV